MLMIFTIQRYILCIFILIECVVVVVGCTNIEVIYSLAMISLKEIKNVFIHV